jgi:hypothetical protein
MSFTAAAPSVRGTNQRPPKPSANETALLLLLLLLA